MILKVEGNASIQIENLARKLGEILTGSEITRLFSVFGLSDIDGPSMTKYKRIYDSFAHEINIYKSDKKIINFIQGVFDLTNYQNDLERFNINKEKVNSVLIYLGCSIDSMGKVVSVTSARTIDEALSRQNKLQLELQLRKIHPGVMKFSSKEYLQNDYFHACFEAVKGLFKRLKELVNLNLDGNKLIDQVFSKERPLIIINMMSSVSEKDEFEGVKNLFLYLHKSVRNYEAHETRLNNEIELERALDLFVCISLAHKYLDKAQITCYVNENNQQ